MLYVHAGVVSGESEEVVDGFVWQNNQEAIQGSWKAMDSESGILEYRVSIGTSEGRIDFIVTANALSDSILIS